MVVLASELNTYSAVHSAEQLLQILCTVQFRYVGQYSYSTEEEFEKRSFAGFTTYHYRYDGYKMIKDDGIDGAIKSPLAWPHRRSELHLQTKLYMLPANSCTRQLLVTRGIFGQSEQDPRRCHSNQLVADNERQQCP